MASPTEAIGAVLDFLLQSGIDLGQAGLLSKWNGKPSKEGTGFEQPLAAHQHWHIDVSSLNTCGTFYYLFSILDGYSRFIVNWDIRESMTEADIEIILQGAKERYPEAKLPVAPALCPVKRERRHPSRPAAANEARCR